jgi:hypothetical protein
MSRGTDNAPTDNHLAPSDKCKIVFHEQSSHRKVSRGRGAPNYAQGRGGAYSWQSHHLVCICAVGNRTGKDDKTVVRMEQSLYITEWNINKTPNMIGLPMYRKYVNQYCVVDKIKDKGKRLATLEGLPAPKNLPAHDIDHNTDGGYTSEVITHMKTQVWNKFNDEVKDHKKGPEWLIEKLEGASKHFAGLLVRWGNRKGGTAKAWSNRRDDDNWADPFSMATEPNQRNWGEGPDSITNIFEL